MFGIPKTLFKTAFKIGNVGTNMIAGGSFVIVSGTNAINNRVKKKRKKK